MTKMVHREICFTRKTSGKYQQPEMQLVPLLEESSILEGSLGYPTETEEENDY